MVARVAVATIAVVLLAGGFAYYRAAAAADRETECQSMAALADVGVAQISSWAAERALDVRSLARAPGFAAAVARLQAGRGSAAAGARVRDYLRAATVGDTTAGSLVLAPGGDVLVAPGGMRSTAETRDLVAAALAARRPVISTLFRDSTGGGVRSDAAAPVLDASGHPIGVVIVRSDAGAALNRRMHQLQPLGRAVEVSLVEREGDNVVSLTDVRSSGDSGGTRRVSITRTDLPSVRAALGARGRFEGPDARGVPVIAELRNIPGTPWFLMVKSDADRGFAALGERAVFVSLAIGLLILLTVTATSHALRRRQIRTLQVLYDSERARHASEGLFQATLYSMGDALMTTDTGGLVREMNRVAERLTGWTEAEARGQTLDQVFRVISESSREILESPVSRALREGKPVELANHTLLIAQDGTEYAIADSAAPIRDESGRVTGVVLVFSDRTAQHVAEHARMIAEERLRLALVATNQGVFDFDIATGGRTAVNREYSSMLGFDPDPAPERVATWIAKIHPEDRDRVSRALDEHLAGTSTEYEADYRIQNRAGDWRWMRSQGKVVTRSPDGAAVRMVGTRTDITERKTNEARILRLSRLYAALSKSNQAIIRSRSEHEVFDDICEAAVTSGSAAMAWIGMVDDATQTVRPVASYGEGQEYVDRVDISADAMDPSGRRPMGWCISRDEPVWVRDWQSDPSLEAWRAQGKRFEWRSLAALPLHRNGKPIGALGLYADAPDAFDDEARELLLEMARDISFALDTLEHDRERHLAAAALQESEARLRKSQEIARMGFLDWNLQTNGIYWSDEVVALFGRSPGANLQTIETTVALVHPEDQAFVQQHLDRAIQGDGDYNIEHRMVQPDGGVLWVHAQGELFRDTGGAPVRLLVTVVDITAMRHAQSELRLQSAALMASADAIMITDAAGTVEWVNPAFTTLTGYTSQEAVGRNSSQLVKSGAQDSAFYRQMWDTLLTGKTWRGEITNRRKDGTHYPEEMAITPVTAPSGAITHFVAVKRDVGAQRQLEAQFLQSQKMETVGRLAGGIAHDFNNLITVINGTVELIGLERPSEEQQSAYLETIAAAGTRAAQLTRQLLAFSRKQLMRLEPVYLNSSLRGMESLLRRTIGEDIELRLRLAENLGLVQADSGQLDQVILNLVVNARDAMSEGGTLSIDTENVELDADYAASHPPIQPGPHVMLAVSD
ncbi:MAG: PAS domain-containing protein, partial [Gemmatimonadaceae bacterium]